MTAAERIAELEAKLAEAERLLNKTEARERSVLARVVPELEDVRGKLAAAESREKALREALLPFVDQRRCMKGPVMEGDCIQSRDPKPCRICAGRAALAAGKETP